MKKTNATHPLPEYTFCPISALEYQRSALIFVRLIHLNFAEYINYTVKPKIKDV